MMSRIEPIRRSDLPRRAQTADPGAPQAADEAGPARLPVPVTRAPPIEPRSERPSGRAELAAQLIGQDGAKRGLRAGPAAFDAANNLYNRTEWSGSKDRRSRRGANARAEV
ncbi:MAG TPA: hypothetical protein VLI41_15240 [Phenylobacterium sp.]|uniref:hypothetical protein n=1 Tax=Phenylobacterium sp. TaxID=1871053 RepID=UPI002CB71014|nr:hypothetical protein [Phenylobacterium sp.]HSV04548.1 hypothetical protein [Phenylobacterium sp.]